MKRTLSYLRRHHLGFLAIAVLLGGTAYAAANYDAGDFRGLKGKDLRPATLKEKHFKPDSLTGLDIDDAQLNTSRVVARLRDTNDRTVPRTGTFTQLADVGSWVQRPDELDKVIGQAIVSFPAGCNPGRAVQVVLARPGTSLAAPPLSGIVAGGLAQSPNAGAETVTMPISATSLVLINNGDTGQFEPGADVTRTLNVHAAASCGGGSTADPVITDINLNVIGHR